MTNEATAETFSAVCGQKCGPVQVASLDMTNCPQCGHPLTTLPSIAAPAGSESYAEMQARVEREGKMREGTLAGTPIVSTETKQPSAADLDAVAAEQKAAEATAAPAAESPEMKITLALIEAGYAPNEAADLAFAAIDEITKRKASAAAPSTSA